MTAGIILMLLAVGIIVIRREYRCFAGDRRNYPYGWEPEDAQLFTRNAPSQEPEDDALYDDLSDDDTVLFPPAR